jgi:hypothetical protein
MPEWNHFDWLAATVTDKICTPITKALEALQLGFHSPPCPTASVGYLEAGESLVRSTGDCSLGSTISTRISQHVVFGKA